MENSNRPINTLFMLMSLDGKINSGDSDELDVDKDWCKIDGVKEGLHKYYEIEQTTDYYSLNTGRTMAKIGVNDKAEKPNKIDCRFIIIDRKFLFFLYNKNNTSLQLLQIIALLPDKVFQGFHKGR